jgi:hypothetical protein
MSWTQRRRLGLSLNPHSPSFITILAFTRDSKPLSNPYFNDLTTNKTLESFKNLLSLGPKYIPPPENLSSSEIQTASAKFIRSIKIAYHFKDDSNNRIMTPTIKKLRIPQPSWNPSKNQNHPTLKQVLLEFKDQVKRIPFTTSYTNPIKKSYLQHNIQNLLDAPDIKLCNSDKNLGVIAINTDHYHSIVMTQLQSNYYLDLGCISQSIPLLSYIGDKYYRLIIKMSLQNETTQLELDYLKEPRTHMLAYFHTLPKIHKPGILKGRPIISCIHAITTPASIVLDTRLLQMPKPLHILKNSLELKERILGTILNPNQFLVTMDVTSLYTNIKTNLLMEILPGQADLIHFICDNNYFTYNDTIFKQQDGLAMGTNSAVNLANHYLLMLIDPYFLEHPKISLFHRFIDDLFFIYTGHKEDLELFQRTISTPTHNSTGLAFTSRNETRTIDFLDITLYLDINNRLQTTLYQKPLNMFLYIPFISHHPKHVLSGFIYGESLRISNLCSTLSEKELNIQKFTRSLIIRGYPRSFVEKSISPSLIPSPKKTISTVNLILRHTDIPRNALTRFFQEFRTAILDDTNILLRTTARNSPNLQKILYHSSLSEKQKAYLKSQQE